MIQTGYVHHPYWQLSQRRLVQVQELGAWDSNGLSVRCVYHVCGINILCSMCEWDDDISMVYEKIALPDNASQNHHPFYLR